MYNHSFQIYFKTNKGREIGPYGTETDIDQMNFKASYNGAPLLYVEGVKGMWLYQLSFFFHGMLIWGDVSLFNYMLVVVFLLLFQISRLDCYVGLSLCLL